MPDTAVTPEQPSLFFEELIHSYLDQPRFLPRPWLAERVQALLDEPDCRFVLLTGEPGSGKTAFMAQLAGQHPDWLRYFIRRDSRQALSRGDTRSFLFAAGHQLAVRRPELFRPDRLEIVVEQRIQKLSEGARATAVKIEDLRVSPFYQTSLKVLQQVELAVGELVGLSVQRAVLEERLLELGNLQSLALYDPAALLLKEDPPARLVILLDALDELRYQPGGDHLLAWLASAPELPENVRFVLSARPDDELLAGFRLGQQAWLKETILPTGADQAQADPLGYQHVLADVRQYAHNLAALPFVQPALTPEKAAVFVRQASEKADGNLGYLDALGRALEAAFRSGDQPMLARLLELSQVPGSLNGLYAFFLTQVKARLQQESVEVTDPASGEVHFLKAWPAVYRRVLGALAAALQPVSLAQVRSFGAVQADADYVLSALGSLGQLLDSTAGGYRFYHSSLPEFLTAESTRQDPALQDLAVEPARAHQLVVSAYRGAAAGWQQVDWEQMDDYGLLHLAEHLRRAGSDAGQALDLVGWPIRKAMLERFGTDAPFQDLLDSAARPFFEQDDLAQALPALVFLGLVKSQVMRSGNLAHPKVLGLMARLGYTPQALVYLALMAPGQHRFNAALEIYQQASPEQRAAAGQSLSTDRLLELALEVSAQWGKDDEAIEETACLAGREDLGRGLSLLPLIAADYKQESAPRRVWESAVQHAPLELVQGWMAERQGPAELYGLLIERLLAAQAPVERLRQTLLEFEARPEANELLKEETELTCQVIAAWAQVDASRAKTLRQGLARRLFAALPKKPKGEQARYKWLDKIVKRLQGWECAARRLAEVDNELAQRCLQALDPQGAVFALEEDVYSLDEWHASSAAAAELWLQRGEVERGRAWLQAVVEAARQRDSRYRYRLLLRVAKIIYTYDAEQAAALVDECLEITGALLGTIIDDLDQREVVRNISEWFPHKALELARQVQGLGWSESDDDQLSLLASCGLALCDRDPAAAQAVLSECQAIIKEAAAGDDFGERATPDWLVGDSYDSLSGQVQFFNYIGLVNGFNDWVSLRKWWIFQDPVEVVRMYATAQLRTIVSPFCLDRTLRRLAEAALAQDVPAAEQLLAALQDPVEAAAGYAALYEVLAISAPQPAELALQRAADFLQQLLAPGETFRKMVAEAEYPQQVIAYGHLFYQALVEAAARLIRFYPDYATQLVDVIGLEMLRDTLLAKSCDSSLDGSLENFRRQAQQFAQENQMQTDDPVASFHIVMANSMINTLGDPLQLSLALGQLARSQARFSLEQALALVEVIPEPFYQRLAQLSLLDFLPPEQRTAGRAAELCRTDLADLPADWHANWQTALLARSAQALAAFDPALSQTLLEQVLAIARQEDDFMRLLILSDTARFSSLHPGLLAGGCAGLVQEALPSFGRQHEHHDRLMLVFPGLLGLLPQVMLPRLYAAARDGSFALLALLDWCAEVVVEKAGAQTALRLREAIERSRTCMGE